MKNNRICLLVSAIFVIVKLGRFSLELETGCATTVARSYGARDQIRRTGNRPLLFTYALIVTRMTLNSIVTLDSRLPHLEVSMWHSKSHSGPGFAERRGAAAVSYKLLCKHLFLVGSSDA